MTDDQDPTGVRHLLAGLKESGPMPDELNDRIRASLEQEQARKDTPGESSDGGDGTAFWSEMESDQSGPRRRKPATLWVLGLAVAAVVAVGIVGVFALGSDETDPSPVASGGNTPEDEGGSSSATSSDPSSSSGSSSTPEQVPAFAITDSGTNYSRASLPGKAEDLAADPLGAPELTNAAQLDGMDTAAAASDCLARLGQPELMPIVVDVATFEGKEGLLLMGQQAPEGNIRAWAVTTGCEPIWNTSFAVTEH